MKTHVPICTALFSAIAWARLNGAFAQAPLEPTPSSLVYGAIVRDHVLSYQLEPKPAHDPRTASQVVRWYWGQYAPIAVQRLEAVLPQECEQLRLLPPPHRWRVTPWDFWATSADDVSGIELRRLAFFVSREARSALLSREARSDSKRSEARSGNEDAPRVQPGQSSRGGRASGLPPNSLVDSYYPGVFSFEGRPELRTVARMRFLHHEAERGHWAATQRRAQFRFDFNVLPLSQWRHILLVLVNDEITVWEIEYEAAIQHTYTPGKDSKKAWPVWKGVWRDLGAFRSPFSEPFHLAAADGAYFLVTDSGAVYMAEETKGEWKTRAVWKDEKRPIIAMLAEADSPGGFVFGKDFYFRLGREVKPKPCEDVTKGRPDLTDPMRTVFQCGLVLHKNGELRKPAAAK